jgi:hypothetical protein
MPGAACGCGCNELQPCNAHTRTPSLQTGRALHHHPHPRRRPRRPPEHNEASNGRSAATVTQGRAEGNTRLAANDPCSRLGRSRGRHRAGVPLSLCASISPRTTLVPLSAASR